MDPNVEQFLTVEECAQLLKMSVKTIYAMVSEERIPYRKVGRRVRFVYSEIMDWTRPKDKGEGSADSGRQW